MGDEHLFVGGEPLPDVAAWRGALHADAFGQRQRSDLFFALRGKGRAVHRILTAARQVDVKARALAYLAVAIDPAVGTRMRESSVLRADAEQNSLF